MNLWEQAKAEARAQGNVGDWSKIMKIYREKGGIEKSITLSINQSNYELVGESDTGEPIVRTNGTYMEMDSSLYHRSKKIFKSKKDLSKLVPVKKWINRKDGSGYMGTVYVSPEEKQAIDQQKKQEEVQERTKALTPEDNTFWRNKTAELQADIGAMWQLQCRNLYQSSNLGALAVREGVQNARDAVLDAKKQGKIDRGKIDISWEGDALTIQDNGVGMDTKTLHTKFLSLGGTTKGGGAGDGSSVGGFGVAKAVILGCGTDFEIHTRDNYLDSNNLGVGTVEERENLQGTRITIQNVEAGKTWDGETKKISDKSRIFEDEIRDYLETSDVVDEIDVSLNGEPVQKRFMKTADSLRSLADFNIPTDAVPEGSDIEINIFEKPEERSHESSYLYVRLGGLTQFKQYLGYGTKSDVVLDFDVGIDPRSEKYPFSSSRESLKSKYEPITRAIETTLNKNPNAITSKTKYKETVFDNKNKRIEFDRKISRKMQDEAFNRVLDKMAKEQEQQTDGSGMEARGTSANKQFTILDFIQQQKKHEDKKRERFGDVEEDVTTQNPVSQDQEGGDVFEDEPDDGNPLEHAWLVWEEKDREGEFDITENLEVLMGWDLIMKKISETSPSDVPVFYPGFILEQDTLGMSVGKTVETKDGKEHRKFVMINPEDIPTDNDMVTALYLKDIACHELAHAINDDMDAHGEKHSYLRESLSIKSNKSLQEMIDIVKDTGMRKKLTDIKRKQKEREERIERQKEKESYLKVFADAEEEFVNANKSEEIKELVYWAIHMVEETKSKEGVFPGDTVINLSQAEYQHTGDKCVIVDIDREKDEVTLRDAWNTAADKTFTVKMSQIAPEEAISKFQFRVEDYLYDMGESGKEIKEWMLQHGEVGTVALMNKYGPSYNMRKLGQADYVKRLDSLKGFLKEYSGGNFRKFMEGSPGIKQGMESDPSRGSYNVITAREEVRDQVRQDFRSIMNRFDPEYYHSDNIYDGISSDEGIKKVNSIADQILKDYMKSEGMVSQDKPKPPKKSTKKPKKEKSPEEKNLSQDLKQKSNAEVFKMAEELGVEGLDKYDNEGIRRMRAIMGIKKKVLKKSTDSYVITRDRRS